MGQYVRRYDIDWLRVISVLLLIPFHTAIMFSLNPDYVVYVKSKIESPMLVEMAMLLGIFHMPLLFVLAGMSIIYSLNKRSPKVLLKDRVKKLLIPVIGGVFIWNQLTTYLYKMYINENGTLLAHYLGMFSKPVEDFTGRNGCFTVILFWFATFLFAFSIVGLPIFIWMTKPDNKMIQKLAIFFEKPFTLAIPYAMGYLVPILDDKNPIAYFIITLIGGLLASDERYQKALDRDKWIYLIYSIVATICHYKLGVNTQITGVIGLLSGLIEKSVKLTMVYALIGIGHCYLNKSNKCLAYLSKSSFTIYVIHMLMNTIVGYFVLRTSLTIGMQFVIICLVTYALSFGTYEIVCRSKWTRILFGMPTKKQSLCKEGCSANL